MYFWSIVSWNSYHVHFVSVSNHNSTQTLYRANLMRFELLRIFCNYLTCVLWDDLRCAIAPKNLSFMTQQASFFSPVWYEVVKSDWRITVYACRDGKSANKIGEFCLFVYNRGDTMHYWTRTNYGALLHSSMSRMDNTTQYHGGHPINGVMPSPMLLVFLTPRQALSSHPRQ